MYIPYRKCQIKIKKLLSDPGWHKYCIFKTQGFSLRLLFYDQLKRNDFQ